VNSADAAACFAAMPGPLEVTTLLIYEFSPNSEVETTNFTNITN
jgi:hypothetical protein